MKISRQEKQVLFLKYNQEKLNNYNERMEQLDKNLKELTKKKKQEKEAKDLNELFKESFKTLNQ